MIGRMDKRITIQEPVQVADGMLGQTTTWTDKATVWAAVWPVSGKEIVKNMSLPGVITHRIRIRYRSGVTPACRILFKARYFNIVSVINIDEKKEFLELICKEDV